MRCVLGLKYVCLCFDGKADVGLDCVAMAVAAKGTYRIILRDTSWGGYLSSRTLHFKKELALPCVCVCIDSYFL